MATGGVSFNLAPMVKFVHRSYQLIGLCPYKLPPDINSEHFTASWFTVIYSVTLTTLSITALFFNIFENAYENMSGSPLLNMTSRVMLIGGVFFHIFSTIYTILIRHKTWRFIRNITNIDYKLQSLGIQLNYQRQYWFVQMFTVFWISIATIMVGIHCYFNLHAFRTAGTFFTRIVSHIVAVGTYGAIMSHFGYCLILIYSRFVCLNIAFRHRFLSISDGGKNATDDDEVITRFRIIHDAIVEAVAQVNTLLSLVAFSGVSVTQFLTVVSISALYKKYMIDFNSVHSLSYFNWTIYFSILALINIVMASLASSEGKSTGVLVHKAINKRSTNITVRHLRLFSQQLRIRKPIVTCWLYNYDWELIYTMCSSISMYTLIFIQFDILAAQNQRTNFTI